MEQQVEVEIVTETITAQYGTLTVGSILRTGTTYAAHLVDECMAARYPEPKAARGLGSAIIATEASQPDAEGLPDTSTNDDVQTSAQAVPAPRRKRGAAAPSSEKED